ncbi:DNA replication and repair protein RecN [Desulfacinum hydrothermale DSM 13146]|uniref:DNA repair protein RecN n=1 Tax=Desulfacinum hydrothermale DSM 13146 TaxID=1121390 RepID=A0A1W1X9S7_9BACT|nr:DNA repair protein RecN [Desulfacinum hydrothermale]SMC20574.1 DNA replication and repair protein RecN [Desulfacinum hydrothermale DSM 13146]
MLSELIVHNFAIIRRLHLSLDPGLTILTGETGAGKSILVGAVNLVLGSRASQEMIRTGAEEATVEAIFTFDSPEVLRSRLAPLGLEPATELLIKRTITRSGRNRVFINGQLSTVQQLQGLAQGLISISGQHEHQTLLDPEVHLELLDRYGELGDDAAQVAQAFQRWAAKREALKRLRQMKRQRQEQLDFMRFQLQELEAAQLQEGEDETLEAERRLLKHAATLHEAASAAYGLVYRDQGAVLERLDETDRHLQTIVDIDPSRKSLQEYVEQARIHMEELSHGLQEVLSSIRFDPGRLAQVEDRLAVLGRLANKYGPSVAHMIRKRDELRQALASDGEVEWEESQLEKEIAAAFHTYRELARALSHRRKEAAERLQEDVERVLARLDLPRARFQAAVQPPPDRDLKAWETAATARGVDRVEFLLSANPGEDLKPLAKVASGGELSRILLALKTLLSHQGEAETLVFDEVDTGIGGRTAELVGRQLQQLSERFQVLCITHLPQIACFGRHHFRVHKESDADSTRTSVTRLDDRARVEELARMLGGVTITEKTLDHAREWLERAR